MIKVLNIISDRNIGGAGRCLLNFLKHYNKTNFSIKVVIPKNSLLVPEIKKLGVQVIEVDGIADKSFDIKAILKLRKLIKAEKPQIVHTHSAFSGRIAAKMCLGTKIVYTRHSVFPVNRYISKGIGKYINKAVNEFFANQIIAVAEAAKKNLVDSGISPKKIKVILNGVEPVKRASEAEIIEIKRKYNLNPSTFVIGILARLNHVKGHHYLIEAVKDIVKIKGDSVKVLIVGTGEIEAELKAHVKKLGLDSVIIFTGFIEDVSQILNILDLQVNASYGTEATSLSLLEGMSIGIPAVVTDYGGNPGVIHEGENGLIVKTKDINDLKLGILKLIQDDGMRLYMNKRAIEIFNKRFTAEIYCRNIEKVYKNLIKEGN